MAERPLTIVRDIYSPALERPLVSLELVPPHRPGRLSRWPRWIFMLFVLLWLVDASVSLLIHYGGMQKSLTARLAAAFGRPVEVGHYSFSLWTGPVLQAQSVTVGEDSRFGDEYFIRAESLSVRLRWQSLLRGRLALGTLSFSKPSLNVVRNSAGEWNLAEWLPRPNQRSSGVASNARLALPFERIQVDAGRVNFKLGDQKLAFAFVGVNGTVDSDGPGRWRMDLQATPWRVSTLTQQAGTVHIAAHVGGTSSRLLPASLDATWTGTSIPDALRLVRGNDYGVRGSLAVAISARTTNGEWNLQTRAQMRQVHRWNLALRPDNPDLNFLGQIRIDLATSELEVVSGTLEAAHSNAHISGRLLWQDGGSETAKSFSPAPRMEISDAAIDFEDALAWLRAFHAGVSDRIAIQGWASLAGSIVGWPAQIQNASLSSHGADLTGLGFRAPVRISNFDVHYDPTQLLLSPLTVSLGLPKAPPLGMFRLETSFKPGPLPNRPGTVHLAGNTGNAEDLITAAGALGWNLARGWAVGGPMRCDLRWQGAGTLTIPWRAQPLGFVELGGDAPGEAEGVSLRAPFLNQPIEQVKARADFKPGMRHVVVSSALAFGANWTGTFDWREPDRQWQFVVSADRLATPDLDRWLNPRWRETLIDRMLPFLNLRSGIQATPEILHAQGHLNIGELALGALTLRNVRGGVEVGGRHLEMTNASARFYGGDLNGSLVADLTLMPTYQIAADFSNVDLAAMTSASAQLDGLFGGSASGHVSFVARGATRADLLSSLHCDGSATMAGAQLRAVKFVGTERDSAPSGAEGRGSTFSHATATFSCSDSKVRFENLSLIGRGEEAAGSGVVDFGRNIDFRFQVLGASDLAALAVNAPSLAVTPNSWYQLTGTLSSPQISHISLSSRRVR